MIVSAVVRIEELAQLCEFFERNGRRIRSKSEIIQVVISEYLRFLRKEKAKLQDFHPREAVEYFERLRMPVGDTALTGKEKRDLQEIKPETEDIKALTEEVVKKMSEE